MNYSEWTGCLVGCCGLAGVLSFAGCSAGTVHHIDAGMDGATFEDGQEQLSDETGEAESPEPADTNMPGDETVAGTDLGPCDGNGPSAWNGNWATVAANPQRTSWSTVEVSGDLSVEWYLPIEAYIPQNVQLIASDGLIYVSTARGLYALDASTGELVWRFDTELPLGNSPTVFNGVLYVGGYDRLLHALDAKTGKPLWDFAGAGAGFSTNPLVADCRVIAGNRDGSVYAIGAHGTDKQGELLWKYATGGLIDVTAAYKDGVVYIASNDNFAYAISIVNGELLWKSSKLPGDGFHSYWLVVHKDKVILSGASAYRNGMNPGSTSFTCHIWSPTGGSCDCYDNMQTEDLFYGIDDGDPIGADVSLSDPWTHGNQVIDGRRLLDYFEDNPQLDSHLHKPWRRTTIVLNRSDGQEYTFDSNNNGYPEYAPFAFWGTRSGNRYPPIVGPDDVLYQNNPFLRGSIPQGKVMGWTLGGAYLSVIGGQGAVDEPNSLSGGGNFIYRNICCDRVGDSFSITTPQQHNSYWGYSPNTLGETLAPGYDLMWWGVTEYGGYPTATGGYGGSGKPGSPHNGKNGIYQAHGDQNPIIPYQGRLYTHRSNAVLAIGPGTARGKLPLVTIQAVKPALTTPSVEELKLKLEAEVQKMIQAKHLRPGYFNVGQAGYSDLKDYFDNPGETIYSLARAYPYLSPALQTQTKDYLQREFTTYFDNPEQRLYARVGWKEGAAREAMPFPPDITSLPDKSEWTTDDPGCWRYPVVNIYALWLYAKLFPEDLSKIYAISKNILEVPVNPNRDLVERPFIANGYIASYMAFLRLNESAGQPAADADLRTQVSNELNRLLDLRSKNFTKDSYYLICDVEHPECIPQGEHYYNRAYNLSRNFIWLVPELGDYLNQYALDKVQEALEDYEYVGPYWFVARYTATEDEGVMQPLQDLSLFQAKAYILKESREQLTKYLDVPAFEKGDLFYINNLIAAIEAP